MFCYILPSCLANELFFGFFPKLHTRGLIKKVSLLLHDDIMSPSPWIQRPSKESFDPPEIPDLYENYRLIGMIEYLDDSTLGHPI